VPRFVPTGEKTSGGVGTVEIYNDTNLDRRVAVKFMPPGGEHDRLLDELAALQLIHSKHVVQVFDVIYPDTRMGIVEEYVDGHDLTDQIGKVAPDSTFVRLLYQMAAGLADIHAAGVVHRDIKPSNIRIDLESILKIIDFNLSREEKDAKTRGFKGTRNYAPPELYGDGEIQFSFATDMYSLAVCAWALLKGEPLPDQLRKRPPEPDEWLRRNGGFTEFKENLDARLLALLNECLSADPTKRPTAEVVCSRAARILVHNRHRASFVVPSRQGTVELSKARPRVRFAVESRGTVAISYDGLDFSVTSLEGEVWINNMKAVDGLRLPDCCVIGLGSPDLHAQQRTFITMDLSHPEVVL
jgi:serine/threonine protein kinase